VAIQRILFPVVLLIGRVLGKYKGRGWPGCPENCKGVPLSEAAIAVDVNDQQVPSKPFCAN